MVAQIMGDVQGIWMQCAISEKHLPTLRRGVAHDIRWGSFFSVFPGNHQHRP